MWTQFWDMHSGGRLKEKWHKIYIEAPEAEAKIIFYNRFHHSPDRVTCSCCGEDYSTNTEDTLEKVTAYHRGCDWSEKDGYVEKKRKHLLSTERYMTLEEYMKDEGVLFIHAEDIKDSERVGELPVEGWVWV